jgi:hypothetical protein
MTQSFTAQINDITDKIRRNLDLVVKDAVQMTFHAATEVQPGVRYTGGSFEIGKVPVDHGFLVGTAFCAINGEQTAAGDTASKTPPDFVAGLAGMKLGDTATAAFSKTYARYVEYGTDKMAGRFFVRQAVQGWDANVKASAEKFR